MPKSAQPESKDSSQRLAPSLEALPVTRKGTYYSAVSLAGRRESLRSRGGITTCVSACPSLPGNHYNTLPRGAGGIGGLGPQSEGENSLGPFILFHCLKFTLLYIIITSLTYF